MDSWKYRVSVIGMIEEYDCSLETPIPCLQSLRGEEFRGSDLHFLNTSLPRFSSLSSTPATRTAFGPEIEAFICVPMFWWSIRVSSEKERDGN